LKKCFPLENTFSRISLGSPLPIAEIKYTKGINGVFGSGYNYHKLSVGVSNYSKIPPFGNIYYNLFAGKTYGTLPYLFLDIAPGNEIYYYNSSAFNMMNRYEFVHDRQKNKSNLLAFFMFFPNRHKPAKPLFSSLLKTKMFCTPGI
jgi:hypothetical protein